MILLKSSRELGHMRAAGRILAEVKERLKALVRPGASTKDIDEDIESFIVGKGEPELMLVSVRPPLAFVPVRRENWCASRRLAARFYHL